MISSVKLKNWKSHLNTEFVFSKGTNALIGISGAGKSSVTDAISFALFGTFPDLQQKKLKLDDVLMNKPSVMSEAEVEAEFFCNGNLFKVMRRIEKGRGTTLSELRQKRGKNTWKLLESPKTSFVTERVESILEIDYDLFSRAIYSNQNRLDFFLEVKPGKRKELIDELLGIDRYEKARVNMNKVLNTANTKVKDFKSALQSSCPEEQKKAEKELEETIKKLVFEKGALEKTVVEKESEIEKAGRIVKKQVEKEEKFNVFSRKKAGFSSSVDSLEIQLEEKKAVFAHNAGYLTLTGPNEKLAAVKESLKQMKEFELMLDPLLKEKNLLEAKLNSADEEAVSLRVELKKVIMETKPADVSQKLDGVEKTLAGFEKKSKELEETAKMLHGEKARIESERASGENEFASAVLKAREIDEKQELFKRRTAGRSTDDLRLEKTTLEKEFLSLEKKNFLLAADLRERKEVVKGLEKTGSKCPLCESDISHEKRQRLIEKNTAVIESDNAETKKIKHDMAVVSEKIKNISELAEEGIKVSAIVAGKKELAEKKLFFEKKLIELEKNLQLTESKILSSKSMRFEVSKDLEKLRIEKESLSKSQSFIARLCDVKSNQVNWRKTLETVEKNVEKISSRFDSSKKDKLEAEQRDLEAVCEAKKLEEKIAALKKDLAETSRQIEVLAFDESELENARQAVSALLSEVSAKKERVKGFLREIESQESHLADIKKQIKTIEDMLQKASLLKHRRDNFRIFSLALEDTQDILRKNFIEEINVFLEDVWPRIYVYRDYSSARLSIESGAYSLQLKNRMGQWVSVEGHVSGGERSVACLALRIAFSFVLTGNLSWLMLDEPTHNLDSPGVELLAEALHDHLPTIVEQIFLITHEQAMEKSVSGSLYCLERNKDEDGVTKVSSKEAFV
ncbi:MAG: SMC family ATPase [Candidatus Diapherotrites archaeon]|nr:SMC family ATPase [Candidatus Diapherotrites archaeon]